MIRDPAGAAASSAFQRVECFCRTRFFSSSRRRRFTSLLGVLALASSVFAGSESVREKATSSELRVFTLDEAIQTAFQRNPAILTARQEIRRTKGLQIEVLSQALPQLTSTAVFDRTDSNLINNGRSSSGSGAVPTPTIAPSPTATPTPGTSGGGGGLSLSNNSYDVRFTVTQLLYNGSVIPAIRGAGAARDASLFALRDTIDQVIATVRQQFYQVILNKALIGVQEESVRLLESQLKDQQNRFEAGTVPRFNVLQAEVALSNQKPALITARNNLRIAQLQLAKTIGLNFNPARGAAPPLECKGELVFIPRDVPLNVAVELGKERRPFLKQQRANILNQAQQVGVALGGYQPSFSLNGGYEYRSNPFSDRLRDVAEGYFLGVTANWAIFDGFLTAGRVKQQRALLSEARIAYDDGVRQVELEVQQAYSNLQQDHELYDSQSKNVDQAREALRLASARLAVGAGVQLDVLNAQVALTQAQSTRLSALFSYDSDLAEFDRVTATDTIYHDKFDDPLTRERDRTKFIKTQATPTPRTVKPSAK